jgi:hypothetical protein
VESRADARSRAIKSRQETLRIELQQDNSANKVQDRRFGLGAYPFLRCQRVPPSDVRPSSPPLADDKSLTEEEKNLIRFRKEREKRLSKNSVFSLEESSDAMFGGGDNEFAGDTEELTHGGTALSRFISPVQQEREQLGMKDDDDEDEDEAGRIGERTIASSHFGGGLFELKQGGATKAGSAAAAAADAEGEEEGAGEGREKTKKERMQEIIMKSKVAKAEKARTTALQQNLIMDLDNQFSGIRKILEFKKNADKELEKATPVCSAFAFLCVCLCSCVDAFVRCSANQRMSSLWRRVSWRWTAAPPPPTV